MRVRTWIGGALIAGTTVIGGALAGNLLGVPFYEASARADGAPIGTSTVAVHVEGMTCASCSATVRITLKRLDGVKDARVSVAEKRAVVDYDPTKVKPQQMIDAINRAGYQASVPTG